MKILGIDYGKSKVGLAIGVGFLAEPYKVIRYSDVKKLKGQIEKIVEDESIEKIIIGVSEAEMGKESASFAQELGAETFDETLTSQDAQRLSIEAGVNRKKRKGMEDAYAATLILQNYLDSRQGKL